MAHRYSYLQNLKKEDTDMELQLLDEKGIQKNKEYLLWTAERSKNKNYKSDDRESLIWQNYALNTPRGKQIYASFTDEELLNVLREEAKKLGHSPAQKEIFWPLRIYIKIRFKKWPYALTKAGLSKSAGSGGAGGTGEKHA